MDSWQHFQRVTQGVHVQDWQQGVVRGQQHVSEMILRCQCMSLPQQLLQLLLLLHKGDAAALLSSCSAATHGC